MGHLPQVKMALEEIKTNLKWDVAPGNMAQFETAIKFCGMERFRLCLKLVTLLPLERFPVSEQYNRLIGLMRLTAPGHRPGAPYRSPSTQRGADINRAMDEAALDAVARDRS